MKLIEILENQKDEYNNFVAASSSGSFLQAWEWGSWQATLGKDVYRYWILNDAGGTIGSIQLIKMPLPFGRYYLYAPLGPVWAESYKLKVESEKLLQELLSKFSDAVFIRIEPKGLSTFNFQLSTLVKSPNIQPSKTLLVNLGNSEEQLLADMHHKTRYNIKVAQKHNVEVKEELEISIGHGIYFKEAINLICETANRQGFTTYPFDYYKNLIDFFILNQSSEVKAHLYKAIFQNQLLTAAVMIDYGKTRTFLFGGSSEFHKNVMAPYLLHWQAMLDAKANNLSTYDFWGIETSSGATPGFVRFKLGFGGEQKEYAGAYDIFNNQLLYKMYSIFRTINSFKKRLF